MTNFLSTIRKARAAYSSKFKRFQSGIDRAYKQFHAIANAALTRELTRRFKRGYWCIAWSHCTMSGEITPALDLTDDAETAVPILHIKGDAKLFPKIAYFSQWENLHWYLLKQQDILVAHNDASKLLVVFAPEQLHLVEKFFTEKSYQLYKSCL